MVNHDQPGLRLRLAHEARRIAAQHEYLDALEGTTLRALERGDGAEMAAALRGFAGSLGAHFSLEEQVQFPALHGLDPSIGAELAELVRDHGRFRDQLDAMRKLMNGSSTPHRRAEILSVFGHLAAELRQHEEREETLLSRAAAAPE